MTMSATSYKHHRFPPQIIVYAVWLLLPVPVEPTSGRGNTDGARHRGLLRNDPSLGKKFGPDYALRLHRKESCRDDIWHLDEVVITIAGRKYWLWRAVDQDGYVLDEIVQNRRDAKAAR